MTEPLRHGARKYDRRASVVEDTCSLAASEDSGAEASYKELDMKPYIRLLFSRIMFAGGEGGYR